MKEFTGDIKLPIKGKVIWLWMNFWKGILSHQIFFLRRFVFWKPDIVEYGRETPSRKHINGFLREKLPTLIPKSDGIVNILDVGCGSGYIQPILAEYVRGNYVGIDIRKHRNFDKNKVPNLYSTFVTKKVEDFDVYEKFDLIISNTCFEHVEDDKAGLQNANRLVAQGGLQVHVLPSFWSLFLYLWHGYRQYTPGRIKGLFEGKDYRVYKLGGVFSFFLHLFLVSIPYRLRIQDIFRKHRFYSTLCVYANYLDKFLPWMSVMYVVVVKNDI